MTTARKWSQKATSSPTERTTYYKEESLHKQVLESHGDGWLANCFARRRCTVHSWIIWQGKTIWPEGPHLSARCGFACEKGIDVTPGSLREMRFHPSTRLDGLLKRVVLEGKKVIEFYEGRDDNLIYRSATFDATIKVQWWKFHCN